RFRAHRPAAGRALRAPGRPRRVRADPVDRGCDHVGHGPDDAVGAGEVHEEPAAAARCTARDVGDPHGAAQCRARAFPHPQGAAQDGPAGRQVAGFFRKKRMKSITYVISSLTAAMIAVPAGAQAPLPAAPKSPLEERRPAAAPAPATPAAKPSSGALECLVEPFMVVNVGSSVDGVLARVAV